MSRASEAEVAEWQRKSTALASTIRRHAGVGGYCPICIWPSGKPLTDPCDATTEARVALRRLCGEQ